MVVMWLTYSNSLLFLAAKRPLSMFHMLSPARFVLCINSVLSMIVFV